MINKSLYLTGALAGALVWSAAAQAAPGETTGNVSMRSGPGTSYAVIGKIPAGASVDILGCRSWCELAYAGRDGYVSANSVLAQYRPAVRSTEPAWLYDHIFDENNPPGLHNHDHHGGHGSGMGGGREGGGGRMGGGHDGGHNGGHDSGHGGGNDGGHGGGGNRR